MNKVKKLKIGNKVKVDECQGISRSQWEGTITSNDSKSPYIGVNGYSVAKYNVTPI